MEIPLKNVKPNFCARKDAQYIKVLVLAKKLRTRFGQTKDLATS